MADRTFLLRVVGDVSDAKESVSELSGVVDSFKDHAKAIGSAILGAVSVVGIVQIGKAVVSSASDQEQAIQGVRSVFGEYAKEIDTFSKDSADKLGISRTEFDKLATTTGALLKNAGIPMDKVSESTLTLTQRASDMAATFGGTVTDAMDAINSGLKGELDPLEKFGVSLKASAVDAKAVAMGYVDNKGKATEYGKAMARMQLIMDQTKDTAGQFGRESDTLAGTQQRMKATFADLSAQMGTILLPVIVSVMGALTGLANFVKDNQGWLLPLAAGITAVVLAMKAWTLATELWTVAQQIATVATNAFKLAWATSPLGLIIVGIIAVVAAFVLLYNKVDWFRAGVDAAVGGIVAAWNWFLDTIKGAFNWIKDNWPLLLAIITGPFGLAVLAIARNWDTIKSGFTAAIEFIKQTVSLVWDVISAPFKHGADLVLSAWQVIKDFFSAIPGHINTVFSGLADIIKYPFRIAFDAVKSMWNSTIGGFGFEVPSWVPFAGGKSFKIPRMATGGIVNRPTIALIGESGREAVVPLDGPNAPGFGGTVVINVYALTANAEVGRQVYNALREYERTTGNTVFAA